MANKEHRYVENVGGVDEDIPSTYHVHMLFALDICCLPLVYVVYFYSYDIFICLRC
jgi:hypothetical protein